MFSSIEAKNFYCLYKVEFKKMFSKYVGNIYCIQTCRCDVIVLYKTLLQISVNVNNFILFHLIQRELLTKILKSQVACCILENSHSHCSQHTFSNQAKKNLKKMSSISLLNPKAETARAAQALAINISASKGLQDVMKTNLGPKGTMKM